MIKIEELYEEMPVYDITVDHNSNFYANGILIHNCQEIALSTKPMGQTKRKIIRVKKSDVDKFEDFARENKDRFHRVRRIR